jgi:hydroxypyruvate reductase
LPAFRRSVAEKLFALVNRTASVRGAMRAVMPQIGAPALVIGGGKAAKVMASAVASRYPGVTGALAVPHAHEGALSGIRLVGAGHPLPDDGSLDAVNAQEAVLRTAGPGSALFLLSGGATALLGAPVRGLTLDELRATYEALLGSGLTIHEMNAVRRRLTRWGGGKLAAHVGRPVSALVVSDVMDDDLATIASGPLTPDPLDKAAAVALAEKAKVPQVVLEFLRHKAPETLKAGDRAFADVWQRIVLSNRTVVEAMAPVLDATIVGPFTGDVGVTADAWGDVLRGKPGVYVAGAEPTVVLGAGPGRGGRNQHLILELVERARPGDDWLFLSVATDGVDGNSLNAGGWMTAALALEHQAEARRYRATFDSAEACESWGVAFSGGATGTNVADVHVAVVGHAALATLDASLRVRAGAV